MRAEMPYAHFPGALLMEVLVAFFGPVLGFFAYCFGGHALATDELERALRPEIEGAIGGSMESILPSIQEAQSYQAFFEDINLRSDSITLSGQMESGRIALGGVGQRLIRPNLDSVEIDDSDSERMTFQILNFSGLLAVACRLESEPISEPPSLWRITGGDHLFEMTDMDSLVAGSRREERSHVTWGNGITSVLGLPGSELDLSGHTIFGVRTPGGACTKIRLMSTLDDNIAIRWVTYAPPPEPLVEIDGSWRPIDNTWPFRNRHYLGFFRINFDPVDGRGERIHNPATFEGRPYLWWTLSTHGRALAGGRRPSSTDRIAPPTPSAIPATTLSNTEVPPDDWNRVQIYTTPSNLPNELLEVDGSFRFVLQVSVEDIFGRRARTTRDLTGNRLRS